MKDRRNSGGLGNVISSCSLTDWDGLVHLPHSPQIF